MPYVVYHIETLQAVREYAYQKSAYNHLAKLIDGYAVTDKDTFLSMPIPTKMVRNLMTGEMIEIPVNTPHSCDPSTETYWSM